MKSEWERQGDAKSPRLMPTSPKSVHWQYHPDENQSSKGKITDPHTTSAFTMLNKTAALAMSLARLASGCCSSEV